MKGKYFQIWVLIPYLIELGLTSNRCKIYFKKNAIELGGTFSHSTAWPHGDCNSNYELESTKAWCASSNNNPNDWIGINYSGVVLWVGVTTRGRPVPIWNQFVKSYKVKYSENGSTWIWYNGGEELTGNTNMNSYVSHNFDPPFRARAIRIYPVTFNGHKSMRIEGHLIP